MVVTVEPGCYFIEMMFTRGAKEWKIPLKYVNMDKVKEYMDIRGVRVEDDIVITETGMQNYAQVRIIVIQCTCSYQELLKKLKLAWLAKPG